MDYQNFDLSSFGQPVKNGHLWTSVSDCYFDCILDGTLCIVQKSYNSDIRITHNAISRQRSRGRIYKLSVGPTISFLYYFVRGTR
jgi:hypothetical protein